MESTESIVRKWENNLQELLSRLEEAKSNFHSNPSDLNKEEVRRIEKYIENEREEIRELRKSL